mmetsp:Transcript_14661/g.25342  ORF Transcript_14661/g.25342 Transcript_14661/m.25342 type:complete len:284 (+) Transcript_14661:329-1180(+)
MEMFAAQIAREEMLAKVLLGMKQCSPDIHQQYMMPNYHASHTTSMPQLVQIPRMPTVPTISITPNCCCANAKHKDEVGEPPLKRMRSDTTSDKGQLGSATKSSSTILSGNSSVPSSPSLQSPSPSSSSSSSSLPTHNSHKEFILSPVSDQGASARCLSSSSTNSTTFSTEPPPPIQKVMSPASAHEKLASTQATKIYACDKCSSTFCTISNLNKHTRLIHQGIKKFECPKCKQMFGQKSDMTKHILSLHDESKPYQCNHCSSRFNQAGDVTKHVRQKHADQCK